MKQRIHSRKINRRRAKRKGVNPSIVPRKKKFLFRTQTPLILKNTHDANGYPQDSLISGGISSFSVRVNDLKKPWETGTASANGWNHVSSSFLKWYTIGAKVKFNFDMVNVAGYKLYMLLGNYASFEDDIKYGSKAVPNWTGFTSAAGSFVSETNAKFFRNQIQTALDSRISKKLISSHYLQRGDGYHSVGTLSLKYNPHYLDPDRGSVMDDDNQGYATGGNPGIETTASPAAVDYIHIILVPTTDEYNEEFMKSTTAMVFGQLYLEQICVAVNPDTQIAMNREISTQVEQTGVFADGEEI